MAVALAIFAAGMLRLPAAQLDSAAWVIQPAYQLPAPPTGLHVLGQSNQLKALAQTLPPNYSVVFDKNPATFLTLTNLASLSNAPGLWIKFPQPLAVDRVVVCGTNNSNLITWSDSGGNSHTLPAGMVVVYAGNSPQAMAVVGTCLIPYDVTNVLDEPLDIRFSPVACTYLKLALQTRVNWTNTPYQANASYGWNTPATPKDLLWQISEVEVHGCTVTNAANAVVVAANAPDALQLAASDLSYYLTELTGQPHPIVTPAQAGNYPGNLYTIEDLAPLAPDYATMTNNIAAGLLPTNEVNVSINGRVIKFTGWPYRCVCWSVWEFLERQGIRWVYPDVHGDFVPPQTNVDLSMLPLQMQSATKSIYANWDSGLFEPWPAWVKQSWQQSWLYIWRNRWSAAWGAAPWGAEIPYIATTGTVDPQYAEGFIGYPHNMDQVMPRRILGNHPDWWGTPDGVNYSPDAAQFDLASDGAEAWLAQKILAWDAVYHGPQLNVQSLYPGHFYYAYNFLPKDAVTFSIDTNTTAANALYSGPTTYLPWIWLWHPSGGAYYKLLSTVANICTNQIIGGLAYADVFDPPASNYPPNVHMEICLYGSPNLPFTSPANAPMKAALDNWHLRCSRLAHYDYSLLISDVWQPDNRMLVPMVSAFVDNARYLASIGAQNGGVQACEGAVRYNPWDFYAWPRARWNTNQTGDQILNEFFNGFYREAAAPMLAFYKAMENYQYSNNIDLHFHGYCYNVMPGSFPVGVLNTMRTNLLAAQSAATNWFVANRIADATDSFNWVMARLGLTDDQLTNYSQYAYVPASGAFACPLTGFGQYTIFKAPYYAPVWNQNNNQAWNFDGAAVIKQSLNFASAGTYRVDVGNYCSYTDGTNYPSIRVILGPSYSATVATAPVVRNYLVPQTNSYYLSVPTSGPYDLIIAQDRSGQFLTVNSVTLTKQ